MEENGCTVCVKPAAERAVPPPNVSDNLAALAAPSQPWPELSPCAQGWNLQSIEILPAQFPNPPVLSIPRLPPILRVNTRMPADVPPPSLETIPKVIRIQSRRPLFPHWVISCVVVGVISLAIASSIHRFITPATDVAPNRPAQHGARKAPTTLAVASPIPKSIFDAETETEYPFARFVEVSGLRVVKHNEQSQVQYLVMNHSSTQLNDIGLRIAVRSEADSPGAAPLFTLTAQVPRLGPKQSKEMRVDLDANRRTAQIPNWVHLRTDVRVVTP